MQNVLKKCSVLIFPEQMETDQTMNDSNFKLHDTDF